MYNATIKSKTMIKDYISLIVEFSDGESEVVELEYQIKKTLTSFFSRAVQ